jgi:phosphatidate phosphatase LPIN
MSSVSKFFSNLGDILHPKKSAFSGAMDVIVVKYEDGFLRSTNFYVKFGRFKVSKSNHKRVDLVINGSYTGVLMELTKDGRGLFLRDIYQDLILSETMTIASQSMVTKRAEKSEEIELSVNLTSDELRLLNLKSGMNVVHFSVQRKKQTILPAKIYLWDYRTKLVVSDIDGTVSKSDFLGHLYYIIKKDWEREGVVNLYKTLRRKGYQIIYLSARSIDSIDYTRGYLSWVQDNGKHLPDGPVILSPQGLWTSLKREVMKTTHLFKTDALREIKNQFHGVANPFIAGFGNKNADAVAYLNSGLDKENIFIFEEEGKNEEYYRKIQNFYQILEEIQETYPEVDDYLYLE